VDSTVSKGCVHGLQSDKIALRSCKVAETDDMPGKKPTSTLESLSPPSSPFDWGRRIGPRAALVAGFTVLLVIMAVLAFDSVRGFREIEATSAQIRHEDLVRERALRKIRSTVYESGNLLLEYSLSDPRPDTRESYRAQLNDMREHVNVALESCLRGAPANLEGHSRKLATELDSYWIAAQHAITLGSLNQAHLHREALAQRTAVLAIATEVSNINELELQASELDISRAYARSRYRLQNFSVLAISIGLLLAASTILYVSRLERHAEEKYHESVGHGRELKALSRRLVDAQEQERHAISRDLHDHVGQSLAALLMDVQSLVDSNTLSGLDRGILEKIKVLAEECAKETRNIALLLRPSMLDDLGLVAALEWQGREVSRRSGLIVDVAVDDFADNLSDEQKTCIYRVVQEALHNSAKHANARHVRVSVREVPNHVILSIEDDGIGFDPSRRRGMGILGMHERTTRLEGEFAIDSSPGQGTRLRVDLPRTPAVHAGGVSP
jgi:signal transduction histidine kinase